MRQIGTLPKALDTKVLEDYLLSLGIRTRITPSPAGHDVWVINEDHLDRARRELEAYIDRPDALHFTEATRAAQDVRKQDRKLDREFRKNYREVADSWTGLQARRRPVTVFLCAVSIVVFVVIQSGPMFLDGPEASIGFRLQNLLVFSPLRLDESGLTDSGLEPIRGGEVWRLVTPIFLHFGMMHILFNCWATMALGTIIELRRGSLRLAILVLGCAVLSNLGQYLFSVRMDPHALHQFGGLSGVVYGFFGYLWMKGRFEPEQGMILHPNTITTMLIWLLLCMTGALGNIANAAHVVGLFVGILFGVMRY